MKTSELKNIIVNELSKNELFNKLFEGISIQQEAYDETVCVIVSFSDQMSDDYFDEEGNYDYETSSQNYTKLTDYVINVIKKIVPKKVKTLKYEDCYVDGPDVYVYFSDETVSDNEW